MSRLFKHVVFLILYGGLGLLLAGVVGYGVYLHRLPELKPWHEAPLAAEFRAADAGNFASLDDYRALELRLQQEVEAEVYRKLGPDDRRAVNRYHAGSLADPRTRQPDWNMTFEMPVATPRGAALLLHGLSDSPYSMRALAEEMHRRGYWVVGLRLPGHGTAPSALMRTTWQDWAAAVRLAARHLAARTPPGTPLVIAGYSTGAALGVEYALATLQGEALPKASALVLLSPAIGVSPAAAFAVWQGRAAQITGYAKVAWTDVLPEYDPYKYNSFTANAGDQIHQLTRRIAGQLAALVQPGGVAGMPPVLGFQSIVDATVSTDAVVDALYAKLAPGGHALVAFDLNRLAEAQPLFAPGALAVSRNLLEGPALPFELTVVGNENARSEKVVARRRRAGALAVDLEPTGLTWPRDVYSLAHVALPFPPDDPLYGATPPDRPGTLFLGRSGLYGERGLLIVTANDLSRLRHNPFWPYVRERIDRHLASLPR